MTDAAGGERARAEGPVDLPLAAAAIPALTASIAAKLAKGLGVTTVRDLLELTPRRYLDLSKTKPIAELKVGEEATTAGKVVRVDGRYARTRRHMLTVTIYDGTGYLDLMWWNQPFRARGFKQGMTVAVAGRIERGRSRRLQIVNAFVEPLESAGVHVGRIIPVHPATAGVTQNQIRRFVHDALQRYRSRVEDPLPAQVVSAKGLVPRGRAIAEMHFPSGWDPLRRARRRLVFEELFVLSTGLAMRKRRLASEATGMEQGEGAELVERFLESLPFEPTGAQRRALGEIAADLAAPRPMNRLLQGEVGSGKTLVAVASALRAIASGSQVALMAPTEVLAEQHYLTVSRMLDGIAELAPVREGALFGRGFDVVLLTGSVTGKERERALSMARTGDAAIVIGTHALIQEGVAFRRLGLAIVDEQHRFGVHQRVALRRKGGEQPDVLIMTATPIPRTLALTLYGDLDVSTLDEMPPGRTPVETVVAADDLSRARAYRDIRREVAAGRQAFVVCPLVEESSSLEVKAAESEYERIRTEVFPELRIDLIHGRMRSSQKEEVMRRLRAGEADVLVATTVIEVGVDIPNATIMVIEDAERFGLSQLHQLRGRIGRGEHPAKCYLFTTIDRPGEEARREALSRLQAMAETTDGFRLAEIDLEIRGAGHLFGRGSIEEGKGAPAQAGRGDLQFANLVRDADVLLEAREAAFALVADDPLLERDDHRLLLAEVKRRFADRLDWLFVS